MCLYPSPTAREIHLAAWTNRAVEVTLSLRSHPVRDALMARAGARGGEASTTHPALHCERRGRGRGAVAVQAGIADMRAAHD
eukprot:7179976-Pyramimonas_sp.AAC.1